MEKGHIELGEVLVIALLIIGLAAGVLLFAGMSPPSASGQYDKAGLEPVPETPEAPQPESNQPTAVPALPEPPVQGETGNPTIVNGTIGSILESSLAEADSRFYSSVESGQYEIRTYTWTMGKQNSTPDSIPLALNDLRALDVRFNGRYVDSLRGFAYRVYSDSMNSRPPIIYGTAIFISSSNPLEGLESAIDVHFDPHPEGAQILESCKVLSDSEYETPSGTAIKVYDLQCRVMYGASP